MAIAGARRKAEEEGGELAECSFRPVTGRGPISGPRATVAGLPAERRLYAAHDAKYSQVRLHWTRWTLMQRCSQFPVHTSYGLCVRCASPGTCRSTAGTSRILHTILSDVFVKLRGIQVMKKCPNWRAV